MKFLMILVAGIWISFPVFAQHNDAAGKVKLTAAFHELRSTHGDFFTGESITVSKVLMPHWEVGAGIEHSYNPYHDDNGWKLYRLRFVPVYGDVKYRFLCGKRVVPFLHASVGWCFVNYDKQPDPGVKKIFHISESGLFVWAGGGAEFLIDRHWGLLAEGGIKNFHLSYNELEVNPHGIGGRIGVSFRF